MTEHSKLIFVCLSFLSFFFFFSLINTVVIKQGFLWSMDRKSKFISTITHMEREGGVNNPHMFEQQLQSRDKRGLKKSGTYGSTALLENITFKRKDSSVIHSQNDAKLVSLSLYALMKLF